VTGAHGRLGQVLLKSLADAGRPAVGWSRPEYDLDDPSAAERLVSRDQPGLVFHTAGWVDVDGCARDPDLATRRNADATRELARAASAAGADLVLISTNEVFDGTRSDGRGYRESDPPNPANPYGRSKLAGEMATAAAMADGSSRLWIVRTSWLYGPAGNDFPSKIVAAADRSQEPLRVVDDEIGCPTETTDLAAALLGLPTTLPPGTYHLAGPRALSRYEWARDLLARERPQAVVLPVPSTEFTRASTPPVWGVLDCSVAAAAGVLLSPWNAERRTPPQGAVVPAPPAV
jgi:dTDP-4-dehydrorhamnose reductase